MPSTQENKLSIRRHDDTEDRHPLTHRPVKGRYRIVELTIPPEWDGPPLHHHDFDEAFYVLEGELTFQLGNKLRAAGPGELVLAPRGAIHTLANLSTRQPRYLLVWTPGEFTRYFEQPKTPNPSDKTAASSKSYPPTIVDGATLHERLTAATSDKRFSQVRGVTTDNRADTKEVSASNDAQRWDSPISRRARSSARISSRLDGLRP